MSMVTCKMNDTTMSCTDKNEVTVTISVSNDAMSMHTTTMNDPSTTVPDKKQITAINTVPCNEVGMQEDSVSTITSLCEDYLVQNTYIDNINDDSTRDTTIDDFTDFTVEDNVPDIGLMLQKLETDNAEKKPNSLESIPKEIGIVQNVSGEHNDASSTSPLMVQDMEYGNNVQQLPPDCILPESFDPT